MIKLFKYLLLTAALLPLSAIAEVTPEIILDDSVQPSSVERSPLSILQQMSQAWHRSNYDMSFIQIIPPQIISYQYQHVFANQRHYAQLSGLDGAQQEIIQRDNIISYYGGSYQPFSIRGGRILDNIPAVAYADYSRLSRYYDFMDAGKTRIADRVTHVIRILPKDDFRYQYILWIDEQSHLLLRSDMLDRNSELLEQFRVITLEQGNPDGLVNLLEPLNLPPLINIQGEVLTVQKDWQLAWLPPGFELVKEQEYETEIGLLKSMMFSDGLFSFSLYINDNISDNLGEQYWQQADNTIYTEMSNNREITIIGQIPLVTARRIVKDISFH